jgi:DNA adenine methylase
MSGEDYCFNNFCKLVGAGIIAPYGRMGGKSWLKKTLIKYFPVDYEAMTYIEPFFGAGSLYFYKEPSKKEVINDLDKNIYTLMKGFKKYDGEKISETINADYDKESFNKIKDFKPKTDYDKFIHILLLTKLSFFGNMKAFGNHTKIASNYGNKYNERLKHTIISNKDYKEVIKKYDSPNSFFYLDPPYSMSEDYKYYDNKYININELHDLLKNIKGKFLLSYDDNIEARQLFKDFKITTVVTSYQETQYIKKREKKEIVIQNY